MAAQKLVTAALALDTGRLSQAGKLLGDVRGGGWEVDHLKLRLSRTVRRLEGHELLVNDLDLDGESGRFASAGADGTVRVWERDGIDPSAILRSDSKAYLSVSLASKKPLVAAGDEDGFACVWDRSAARLITRFDTGGGAVRALEVASNGERFVTGGVDGRVFLWSTTGELLDTWSGHDGEVNGLGIDAQGERVLSGSDDGTAILWEHGNPDPIHVLSGHEGWIRAVALSPSGLLGATGSDDRTIRVWNLETGLEEIVLRGHGQAVLDVRFAAGDDRLISASDDATIRFWDRHVGDVIETFEWAGATVERALVTDDGSTVVFAAYDESVRVWSRGGATARLEFDARIGTVYAITAHGGLVLAGGSLGAVRLFDARGGPAAAQATRTYDVGVAAVAALALKPDGREFAVALADRTVVQIRIEDGVKLKVHDGFARPLKGLAYVAAGTLAGITEDGEVARFGDSEADASRQAGPRTQLLGVALSPDGSRAAWMDASGTVRVRSTADGAVLSGERINRLARVGALALAPASNTLFMGLREGAIARLDPEQGGKLAFFVGHEAAVTALAHNASGELLVSAGRDRTVRLWNAKLGAELLTLLGPRSEVTSLCFDPSTGSLVAGTAEGVLFVWPRDDDGFSAWRTLR